MGHGGASPRRSRVQTPSSGSNVSTWRRVNSHAAKRSASAHAAAAIAKSHREAVSPPSPRASPAPRTTKAETPPTKASMSAAAKRGLDCRGPKRRAPPTRLCSRTDSRGGSLADMSAIKIASRPACQSLFPCVNLHAMQRLGSLWLARRPMKQLPIALSIGAHAVMFSAAILAGACRSKMANDGGGPTSQPPSCPNADAPDPLASWSGRFPVQRGGVVALLGSSSKAVEAELRRWQSSLGLSSLETSPCGVGLAVWVPGVACPEPPTMGQELGRAAPVVFSRCFPPMTPGDLADACERAALSAPTCAREIPPLANACRPAENARCRRLARLAMQYASDAPETP